MFSKFKWGIHPETHKTLTQGKVELLYERTIIYAYLEGEETKYLSIAIKGIKSLVVQLWRRFGKVKCF